ncbi:hypothetical protein D9M71_536880 [compost metagenome]
MRHRHRHPLQQQLLGQDRVIEQLQAHHAAHFLKADGAGIEQRDHAQDAGHLEVGFPFLHAPRSQQDQALCQLRQAQRQAQGNGASQRVAEQGAAADAELFEQCGHAIDEEIQLVAYVFGLVRAPEARQVEQNVAVAGRDQLRVVALEVAETAGARAAAVQPEHHRALAFVQIVQAQAVGQGGVVASGQGQIDGLVHAGSPVLDGVRARRAGHLAA